MTTFQVVKKSKVVSEMQIWKSKNHSLMDVVKVFEHKEGGLFAGVITYLDFDVVLIPENMDRTYPTYSALFAAVGALFDAAEA